MVNPNVGVILSRRSPEGGWLAGGAKDGEGPPAARRTSGMSKLWVEGPRPQRHRDSQRFTEKGRKEKVDTKTSSLLRPPLCPSVALWLVDKGGRLCRGEVSRRDNGRNQNAPER